MKEHEYRKTVLDSGLTVHTINIPGAKKNYYEVLIKSGSAVEDDKTGIGHYLEHMFAYGSVQFGKKDLLPHFANIGGGYNFSTGPIYTNYYAHALPHKTDEYAERFATVLTGPAFTSEHVELERAPILSEEMGRRDSTRINPFFSVAPEIYGNHRYATPVIGTAEDIKTITYNDLRDYYEGVYVASNTHVLCVGDVKHEDVVEATQRQYATLSQRPLAKLMEPLIVRPGSHLGKMNSGGADITIGFILPYEGGLKDSLDRITAEILSAKLHASIREEYNLAYSIEAYMDATSHEQGLIIKTNTDPSQVKTVVEKIFETIEKTVRDLDEESLSTYAAGQEEYLLDTHDNVRNQGERLSFRIAHNKEYVSPVRDLHIAQNLTATDVKQNLGHMLNGKAFMAIAGPLEQIPQIEIYVNKIKRDLAIDGIGANSNIKEEFNPTDP